MSNTISGGISFSGIGSGTDFNEVVEQLKEIESVRLYGLEDSRDVATESYEAYQELIDVVTEAKEALENLNSPSKFLTKIASTSDETILGVKADANAVDGTHKVEVTQLASNSIWAYKGNYASKDTVINSGPDAKSFTYTYMGEERTLSVPAGTTLEGFANMLNQDRSNPGVKMSLLKTSDGYTFQIIGTDSGKEATLDIEPSELMGLSGAGGVWQSANAVDLDKAFNDGQAANLNSYVYTITPRTGASFQTAALSGDATQKEIAAAINTAAAANGRADIVASLGAEDKSISITNISELTATATQPDGTVLPDETHKAYTESTISLMGDLKSNTIIGPKTYTFKDADNNNVSVTLDTSHTQEDILNALKDKGHNWSSETVGNNTEVTVEGLSLTEPNVLASLAATDISVTAASVSQAFQVTTAELNSTIAGPKSYTFEDSQGNPFTVDMTGEHTAKGVLDKLYDLGYTVNSVSGVTGIDITVNGVSDLSALTDVLPSATPTSTSTSFELDVAGSSTVIPGPATYTFTDAGGTDFDVVLDTNHTQQDILDKLRDVHGKTFTTSPGNPGRTLVTIDGVSNVDALLATDSTRTAPTSTSTWPAFEMEISPTDPIQSGVVPSTMDLVFTKDDGTTHTQTVSGSDSWNSIKADLTAAGITVSNDASGALLLDGVVSVAGIPQAMGVSGSLGSSDAWQVQQSQDAIFKINNWPQTLTSSTNEVTEVIEGVTLSLRDVGTAQITVASDTDSVKDNIQTVLDAVNSVLKKVQDLTAITDDVETTYDDTTDNGGLANTSGSALTGDYSTQLFTSRMKSALGDYPPGFVPMKPDDIFSGDFVASLAQIGIKVSADVDSPDFGLFAIAPHGLTEEIQAFDQQLFDEAIANNLEDVIAFFSNDSVGRSSSADFRYANHIDGLANPGTYDVSYDIDPSGKPINVMIGGVLANQSETGNNTFTSGSGEAAGISIVIDNLTPGTSYTGTVSVQQGKVNQMIDFFTAELKYVEPSLSDPSLGSDNGGLMIAKESYAEMIDRIDQQISDELDRLERWERTEKLKYARLDTLLGAYNGNMEVLNQQLAQLA